MLSLLSGLPYMLVEAAAADLMRSKPDLIAENALLRQQLIVLQRQVKHPSFTPFDRGVLVILASRVQHWKQVLVFIVQTAKKIGFRVLEPNQVALRTMMLWTMAELQHRHEQGVLIKSLMADYRLSKSSVYRHLNQVA